MAVKIGTTYFSYELRSMTKSCFYTRFLFLCRFVNSQMVLPIFIVYSAKDAQNLWRLEYVSDPSTRHPTEL